MGTSVPVQLLNARPLRKNTASGGQAAHEQSLADGRGGGEATVSGN